MTNWLVENNCDYREKWQLTPLCTLNNILIMVVFINENRYTSNLKTIEISPIIEDAWEKVPTWFESNLLRRSGSSPMAKNLTSLFLTEGIRILDKECGSPRTKKPKQTKGTYPKQGKIEKRKRWDPTFFSQKVGTCMQGITEGIFIPSKRDPGFLVASIACHRSSPIISQHFLKKNGWKPFGPRDLSGLIWKRTS